MERFEYVGARSRDHGRVLPGVDVLRACDMSVDFGRNMLRLGREEISLWKSGTPPRSSRLPLGSDKVTPAICERVVAFSLEATLEATNGLVVSGVKTSHKEAPQTARTLLQSRLKTHVRIVNVTDHDHALAGGTT